MFPLRQYGQLIISVTFPFSARFGDILFVFWYFIIYSLSAFCSFFFVCLFAPFGDVSIVLWYYFFSVTNSFFASLGIDYGIFISQRCALQLKQNQMKGKF